MEGESTSICLPNILSYAKLIFMKNSHSSSVLAIGTEVTTGQIVNGNAAWISKQLVDLGFDILIHNAVPDEWDLIKFGLDQCLSKTNYLFVTGGLGPTTDDFTREVIAEYFELPLEFDEDSLELIKERLAFFGREMVPSQKQQCYFPRGSKILLNKEGTAAGFSIEKNGKYIWVLPGPPNEVSAIWNAHIDNRLRQLIDKDAGPHLFKWNCMGAPEADLAEKVEAAVVGSKLLTGYRINYPYVEVKLWCKKSEIDSASIWVKNIETAIEPWIFTRQDEDLCENFLNAIRGKSKIHIFDFATGGALWNRLHEKLKEARFKDLSELITMTISETPQDISERNCVILSPLTTTGECDLEIKFQEKVAHQKLKSPFKISSLLPRARLSIAELALQSLTNHFIDN